MCGLGMKKTGLGLLHIGLFGLGDTALETC